jgi:hypothetical protein
MASTDLSGNVGQSATVTGERYKLGHRRANALPKCPAQRQRGVRRFLPEAAVYGIVDSVSS